MLHLLHNKHAESALAIIKQMFMAQSTLKMADPTLS